MSDKQWQITISVPDQFLDEEMDDLFARLTDTVHDWWPEEDGGWNGYVSAGRIE